MNKNRRTIIYIGTAAMALCIAIYIIYTQKNVLGSLRKENATLRTQNSHILSRFVAKNSDPSDKSSSTITQRAEPFERILNERLERIVDLTIYLDTHPEFRIVQMDALTPDDWFNATNGEALTTEASYRNALALLRGMARAKFTQAIADAAKQAFGANSGEAPANLADLAQYLPKGTNPRLLEELEINDSGVTPGLRIQGKKSDFYITDRRKDLWDPVYYYNSTGGIVQTTHMAQGSLPVLNAINKYKEQHGEPPREATQILSHDGIEKIPAEKLALLFDAYTKEPTLRTK